MTRGLADGVRAVVTSAASRQGWWPWPQSLSSDYDGSRPFVQLDRVLPRRRGVELGRSVCVIGINSF